MTEYQAVSLGGMRVVDATPVAVGPAGPAGEASLDGVTVAGTPTAGQVLTAASGTTAGWQTPATAPVTSVAGRTGAVTLGESDISGLPGDLAARVQVGTDLGGTASAPQVVATHLSSPLPVAQGGTAATSASAARTALGVAIGTDVQAYSAQTALRTDKLSAFAATTSAELASIISNETGSGALVFGTAPVLSAPTGLVKADVGLGSVDNTADAAKPVSTAQAAADTAVAVAASAALASHAGNTSNPHSVTKSQVGLGNADNTADVDKPVSTAQATADALKLAKASNLSDLASASTARTNLGLGGAATLAVGTTAGTVAAGDDSRIVGAAQVATDLGGTASAPQVVATHLSSPLPLAQGGTASSSASAARTALGVVIGTDVEAHDATLTALAGVTTAADKLIYATGADAFATTDLTGTARSLLDDTSASAMRTTLGLAIGTDVQAQDAELAALAGLTSAADRLPYFTGSGAAALATFTAAGRALVDDADAAAQRTTLGLVIGTDVEAHSAQLTTIAGLSPANDDVIQRKAGSWVSRTLAQLRTDLAAVLLSVFTTKGDLLAATGSGAVDRVGVGSNGKVLVADSTASTGVSWADAYAALMLRIKSGYHYFTASQGNSTTTVTHGNNTLRLHPQVIPPGGLTVDRVGAEVTLAGNAGSVVRLGVYADDGTGYPGALIADFGTIDGTSATVQTITVSQAIPAGLVWWGAAVQNAATTQPTLRAVSGNSIPVFIPSGTSAPGSGTSIQGWQMGSVSGALPTLSGLATSGAMARLFYRVA